MESSMCANGPHHRSNGQKRLRVLIVEDDADTADSMAILLRLYTYDVQLACDGATALRAADFTDFAGRAVAFFAVRFVYRAVVFKFSWPRIWASATRSLPLSSRN